MSKVPIFVALYSGATIGDAVMVAASSDPELVAFAAERMLQEPPAGQPGNPVTGAIEQGRRRALRLIRSGVE